MRYQIHAITALCLLLTSSFYVGGFSPSSRMLESAALHKNDNTLTSSRIQRSQQLKFLTASTSKSTGLFLKDDDEDDVEDIDISNRDWREFRAQLVMKDSSSSAESSASESIVENKTESSLAENSRAIIYDDDLDGIGSLFTEEQTPMNTDNFTPLQPSQWAYDAGHVIEQGAVILGGVEQAFGFGLRQQYFHKVV